MKVLLNILFTLCCGSVLSQQLPQFSQNMYNKQMLNPAVTGSEMYMATQLTHRSQWVGFGNSPTTQILGIHSSINHKNYGLGGYVFNDSYGPFSNFGLNSSYAYHIKVSRKTKLGLGLSGAISQFSVDGNKIKLSNDVDPLINLSANSSKLKYNASFGVLLHNEIYYFGLSGLNILPQKDNLYKSNDITGALPSVYHINAIGGVGFSLDKYNTIYPSFLIKYVQNNPIQTEINLRYIYETAFELGVSYRSGDALVGIFNMYLIEGLNLIYSYDFITSNLNNANKGSHEITLKYDIYYDPIYKKQKKRYNLKKVNAN